MRALAIVVTSLLGVLGCGAVLGVEFDAYEEGPRDDGTGSTLACIPDEISRCLCELSEGFRRCDEEGRLGPCVCDAGTSAIMCGNASIDQGETCDDGNAADGDGCSSRCLPDGRPATVEQCPGQRVAIWPGIPVSFTLGGATRPLPVQDGGATCGVAAAPDRIFSLVPAADGLLSIVTKASAPVLVSVRTICESAASATGCHQGTPDAPAVQQVAVTAGNAVYLVLEPTVASPTESFTIEVELP